METAGAVALVVFLLFAALAVIAVVRTVRAVRRSVARGSAAARRAVEDSRLRMRRYTVPGPHGEVARMRLQLRTSIDSTFRALDARSAEDASLTEAAALLRRLNDHARRLDAELALLEGEPDRTRLTTRLTELGEHVSGVTRSADTLRWAAQDRDRHFADDELASLHHDIAVEAAALRHWTPAGVPQPPGAVPSAAPSALGERRVK